METIWYMLAELEKSILDEDEFCSFAHLIHSIMIATIYPSVFGINLEIR